MNNANHTPGPWYIAHHTEIDGGQSIDIRHCTDIPPSAPEIHQVARLPKNALGDANLISAAPDMIQALQAIVSEYDSLMRSQGAQVNIGSDFTAGEWVGSRLGGHIAKAKNLISKAKGEA
jgi:hypothetical protein